MFARVKTSRRNEYLQVVENYRDGDRVRQRVVLYVGHYASVDDALEGMPKDLRSLRSNATRAENHAKEVAGVGRPDFERAAEDARRKADDLAAKLNALRRLVDQQPDLIERDHERAARHARRQQEAMAERTAIRQARVRGDQRVTTDGILH